MAQRSALIDGLKVGAAQLIVLHHIVLYAPMADRLAPAWPAATAFLLDEARFVVQIFLVIGGFLAAQGLSRGVDSLPRALLARYLRLVPMLAVALLAVLAASALLPAGRWPDWVTPWPTLGQFIAHLLLLQDVLGIPSLSAGAWYVSIDFQLYALLAIGTATLPRSVLPWAVAALSLASLGGFSRDQAFDVWALYFFGSYGLGALAAWAGRSRPLAGLFGMVCAVHLAVAGFEARPRVALACLTAMALATLASRWQARGRGASWLAYWSDASYGVFLIHYAVIVAITALWLRLGWAGPGAAWSLLIACWAASLAAGAGLQRWIGALPLSRAARRPDAGPGPAAPRRYRGTSTAAPPAAHAASPTADRQNNRPAP
jgi:peptidoglycan/LPS O-acetylase OafA/YrhL